jgi:ribonuclease HI
MPQRSLMTNDKPPATPPQSFKPQPPLDLSPQPNPAAAARVVSPRRSQSAPPAPLAPESSAASPTASHRTRSRAAALLASPRRSQTAAPAPLAPDSSMRNNCDSLAADPALSQSTAAPSITPSHRTRSRTAPTDIPALAPTSPLVGLFRSLDSLSDANLPAPHPSLRKPAETTVPNFRRRARRPPPTAARSLADMQSPPRRDSIALNVENEQPPDLCSDSDSSESEDDAEPHRALPPSTKQNNERGNFRFSLQSLPAHLRAAIQSSILLNTADSDSDAEIEPSVAAHRRDFQREARSLFEHSQHDCAPNAPRPGPTSAFPFSMPPQPQAASANEPWRRYQFSGSFFLDGGSKRRSGSYGFVGYHHNSVYIETKPLAHGESTNNFAEFQALLNALLYANNRKLKRVLIVTDSELVANFLKGINRITEKHLLNITRSIVGLLPQFQAIFVSRISSHQGVCIENDVADALCTWAMSTRQPLTLCVHPKYCKPYTDETEKRPLEVLPTRMTHLSRRTAPPKNSCCACHKAAHHNVTACPITRFAALTSFDSGQHCLGCLSPHHDTANCFLFS